MCSPAHLPVCIVQQWHLVAVAGNYSNISEPASSSSRLSFNVTINLIKFLQQVQHQRLKRLLEQHINSHNKPISPSHCQDDCYPSVRQPDSKLKSHVFALTFTYILWYVQPSHLVTDSTSSSSLPDHRMPMSPSPGCLGLKQMLDLDTCPLGPHYVLKILT